MSDTQQPFLAVPNKTLIRKIWHRAYPIAGYPSKEWRWDCNGKVIRFTDFGKSDSPYGWSIATDDSVQNDADLMPACLSA